MFNEHERGFYMKKKILTLNVILILLLSVLLLVGCEDNIYYWDVEFSYEDIKEVKVVHVTSSYDEYCVLEDIPMEQSQKIIEDLSTIKMYKTRYQHCASNYGFLFVFNSGEYIIVTQIARERVVFEDGKLVAKADCYEFDKEQFDQVFFKYLSNYPQDLW